MEDASGAHVDDELPESVEAPHKELTGRTRSAAIYEVTAYVLGICLRLGSNLILTRLLEPEAFGLMAMLNTVGFLLWMLSEVGLSEAVVMSPNGDKLSFLNTVFSLQALRGVFLWVGASLLAWPMALFFKEPELTWIIPIGSAATLIHGLASTRVYSLRRQVRPLPTLSLEFTGAVLALIVNVTGAALGYGVKALVASLLVNAVWFAFATHFLLPGSYSNRFGIDREARREILHFGRWIFFSSVLTAVAARGDQVLLGRLSQAKGLGIYNIALALAEMPDQLVGRVVNGAVYPTLARVQNTDPDSFAKVYYRMRSWMDPLGQVGIGGLIGMSDWIIDLLYPDEYGEAAAMLRILAVRTSVQLVVHFCEICFVAQGQSQFSFRRNLAVSVVLLIAMPIGSAIAGINGVLWGSVIARSTALLALWPEARRRGFLRLSRELLTLPYLAIGWGLGWSLARVLPEV